MARWLLSCSEPTYLYLICITTTGGSARRWERFCGWVEGAREQMSVLSLPDQNYDGVENV
ncbi:hypothetical protein SAMN06309944_0786 [Micrococcales bacterium KH10]|nr:hypothetical protein SAMN06309944_0786 [Micrococcales bacterium KH10]